MINIYVNDIVYASEMFKFVLFADETYILFSSKNYLNLNDPYYVNVQGKSYLEA